MCVRDILRLPAFADVTVVAGEAGLDRRVECANVMEVPDIIAWVKPRELLMTTGYPLRDAPQGLADLVRALDAAGVSALAVKLRRYLDDLPRDMIDAADAAGFPVLLLPDDVSFDDLLTEVVGKVLQGESSLAERNEAIGRALVSVVLQGGGLDELAEALHAEIGGLCFVTTPDGRVHAAAPGPECQALTDDSDLFAETGRFRSERFAPGSHRVGELSVSVVALMAGPADHGRLVVIRRDPERLASDIAILERAGAVAALAITKSLAVRAVEAKYRGDFVRDVLLRRAGPAEDVVGHFATLGWDVARPVIVVVASLDPVDDLQDARLDARTAQERFAGAWATVASRHDRTAPVVGFAQEVVVIVGAPAGEPTRDIVDGLVHAVSGDSGGGRRSFATGVSRVIDNPIAIADGYEQARRAVHVGRQLQGASSVAHFDDLGAFRLLSLIEDSQELSNFVKEVLGELADEEDTEAADMRSTLRVLLDTNFNVAETSRRLHFHYNTLRYRISKLEKTVGPFVTDPDLQLDLALALRVMQMRGL
ncbi:MAG TPA: PucR family transcriptional regulator ligand-binding domain-containing protein [Nocardioidaceae bacterium]|nr:PucR family transcriptional regulator ligand-binding domain-containing protein [Nocardioidaceae bacterium]